MKTIMFLVLVAMTGASAQNIQSKSKAKLKAEEVPVAVRIAAEKELGQTDGAWTVVYSTGRDSGRTYATPLLYIFQSSHEGERVELRFFPDGKLKSAKGLANKSSSKKKESV
jgi:hypothetical protein